MMVARGRARGRLAAAALFAAALRGADAGSCSRGCEFFSVGDRCSSNSGCTGSAASCVCESYDNSCAWAHDGECDTMLCADGGRTDCSDCLTCSDGHAGGLFMLGVCVFVASVACMFTSIKHKRCALPAPAAARPARPAVPRLSGGLACGVQEERARRAPPDGCAQTLTPFPRSPA